MPAEWQACAGAPRDLTGSAGLDLSEARDLTALVLVGADVASGLWHCVPTFWLPQEGLADKAAHDRIPYDLWSRRAFCKQRREVRSPTNTLRSI
jgi:phage terminase large subunit-like protein